MVIDNYIWLMKKNHFIPIIAAICLLFSANRVSAQYCIPDPTSGAQFDTYIDSVSLEDINFQDSYSPTDTSYNDYTSSYMTLLTRGETYDITLKGSPYYLNMHYVVWIDYNRDFDFYDANEKLGEFTTTSANQVFSIAFTVPADVDITITRLRVRTVYNITNPDPCTDYTYGETEDYTVSISDYLKVNTGIEGAYGDIAFFNYNTDSDYDLIMHDDMSFTDEPVLFYYNMSGSFAKWDYINGDLPEPDNDNLSFHLCDLNSDNQLDAIFTYRFNSDYARTVHYEKQGTTLNLVSSGFADLKRGTSAAADLNNDGRQDVIICGQDDDDEPYTYIYRNDNGSFTLINDELKGVYGQILAIDYDNDMDIDIFLSGTDKYNNTNAIIYRNEGNWVFTNIMADLNRIGWLERSEFGDFNNDGLPDLVVYDKIYKNNGDDTFTEIYLGVEDWLYDAAHWCDLDNDGFVELISQDANGVVIYKYNGSDSFLIDHNLFVEGESIDIGDYNEDNKQDIIVNNWVEVYILKNRSSITNSIPDPPSNLYSSIGDSGYYSVNLYWDPGQDDATPEGGLTYNIRVGSSPGGNDIVSSMTSPTNSSLLKPGMGNVYFNTSWHLNNLSPGTYYWSVQTIDNSQLASTFASEQQFVILAPLTESSVIIYGKILSAGAGADFDADNDIDLIIQDSLLAIHEQTSPYNYNYHIVDSNCYIIDIVDLNSDNFPDIIAKHNRVLPAETHDSLVLYINRSNFMFDPINLDTLSVNSAVAADFDNDGDIDILVHDEGYFLFESIDSLQYNRHQLPFTETLFSNSISAIDIDLDNDTDFIISGSDGFNGDCTTYVYLNSGDLSFTLSQELYPGLGSSRFMVTVNSYILIPPDIVWNDYNSDGYPDLFITGDDSYQNSNSLIYLNDGAGNLVLTDISPRPSNKYTTSWIDFDTDGYLDLIIPKMGFEIDNIIYLNDHNGGYIPFPNVIDSIESAMFLDAIDVDNDNDKDIICTYKVPTGMFSYTNETKIHTNNYNFTNYPPDPPATITHEIDSFTVILNWSKGFDALTNSDGMTYNIWVGTEDTNPNIVSPLSDLQTGYRFIEDIGNVGTNLSWTLENLPLDTYYWSVQSIDNSLQGSSWASVDSFEISSLTAIFTNDTVCLGFDTRLTDQSVSTNTIDSWLWDFGDGNSSSIQNPSFQFTQAGDNPVKLIVQSGTAIDSITQNVFVKAAPIVDFTTDVVCDGESTTITNTSNTDGLTITDWIWDFGDGSGSDVQNPGTHGYLNPGDYSTTLIALADNGCSDTISKTVNIGAIPIAAITSSGNPVFCSGDSIELSSSYIETYNYQWQIGGTDITNADSSKYIARQTGTFTVEATNPVGNCISLSGPINVLEKPMPLTPILQSDNYVPGECLGENPVKLYPDQTGASYTYQWLRNGIQIIDATQSFLEDYLAEGDYSLIVDMDGCTAESGILNLNLKDAPAKPDLYVKGPVVWYMAASDNAAAQYKWYLNGVLIPDADKFLYVANQTLGTYKVAIANDLGCFTMSDEITIPTTKSLMTDFNVPEEFRVDDIDPFANLKIYPNPTPGMFTVEMDNYIFGELDIRIFSNEGRQILNIKFHKTTEHFQSQIDLSGQGNGVYLINFLLEKYRANRKIIVE